MAVVLAAARAARRTYLPAPPPSVTDRIEQLRSTLAESATLIQEINAEIQLETAALERVRAEADDNRRLASLHQQEADAVKALIDATIRGAQGAEVAQSRRQQRLVFLAGLLLSVPLGVAGNFIFSWLT